MKPVRRHWSPARAVLLLGLAGYRRFMSPYVGGGCRFDPSCSAYAWECVYRYGAFLGTRLTIRRLRRCQPGYPCGTDPVPCRGQIRDALEGRLLIPLPEETPRAKEPT